MPLICSGKSPHRPIDPKQNSKRLNNLIEVKEEKIGFGEKKKIESKIKTIGDGSIKSERSKISQFSKFAEMQAKKTTLAFHQFEKKESAKISDLAKSIEKFTESTLKRLEQNESERITNIIQNMHKWGDQPNNFDLEIVSQPTSNPKELKQIQPPKQPWYQ